MDGYRLYSSLADLGDAQKYAEIDLPCLRENFTLLKGTLSVGARAPRMIAVVKADAYGHGAEACVRTLLACGCDFFAVSCVEEAIAVRRVCDAAGADADVLILGYTDPRAVRLLHSERLIQTAVSEEHAIALNAAATEEHVRIRVHIAINTGMNRIGINVRDGAELEDAVGAVSRILRLDGLDACGAFTHFSSADAKTPCAESATMRQMERYRAFRAELDARGAEIPFHHVCNSAAAVRGVGELFDGVRLGILLYGAYPALAASLPLCPVMRLCTRVVHVLSVPSGECVGYGGEYCAEGKRTVAVLPIGYADGWIRAYTGAYVRLHAASGAIDVPVIGRVCMDQCMVDVTGIDVRVGDAVTLFGADRMQLAKLSERAGSIDYEGLCLISSRVLRIYRDT